MTTALVTTYSGRFSSPDFIERAKDQRLSFEVQYEGATVVPVSGTLTLRDESNVAVVNAAAVTVADGVAVYDLTAALVPASYQPSQRWLEDWTLTFADGQVHTFRRDAHLVLRRLYPVLVATDMTRGRHHDLTQIVPVGMSSLQPYIDQAWDEVIDRLLEHGRYPQQVMTPSRLKRVHLYMALHLAFMDAMNEAPGEGKYGSLATHYLSQFDNAWNAIRLTLDHDEDNNPPGEDEEGQAESPVVFLGGSPGTVDTYSRSRR